MFNFSFLTFLDAFTFANQSYNKQNCGVSTYSAISTLSGNFSAPDVSASTYITTDVTEASQLSAISVIYEPNITVSGNYTLLLFTPGCEQDGTCSSRSGINVTIEANSYDDATSLTLYETNVYDKYDTIYTGNMDKISDSFRPRVTLTPPKNQPVPFVFVADRLQLILNSVSETITINALFEFDSGNFTNIAEGSSALPVGNTTINSAGPFLGKSAMVNTLYANNDTLFVGGNFSSSEFGQNIVKIGTSVQKAGNGGLNGHVNGIQNYSSDELVIYGSFDSLVNSTLEGVSNIALYNPSADSWSTIAHGTNGEVTHATSFDLNGTTTLGFSGNFTEVLSNTSNTISVDHGFGLWVTEENVWFDDSTFSKMFLQARLSASASYNNSMFYAGYIRYFSSSSSGAAFVNSDFSLSSTPFSFVSSNSSANSSSLAKRASISTGGDNVINDGTFANASFSILGGHFTAKADGLVYSNLIMINDDIVSGFPNNTMDDSSIFHKLQVFNNILYAGGSISGTANSNNVSGLVFYDLAANAYSANQPPGISGGDDIVTSIQMRPNTDQLIVAGSFEQAGSLACPSFCVYDLSENRWYSPSPGLSGTVSSMEFIGNNLLVFAGDLTLNNTNVYLAQYNFLDSAFSTFGEQSTSLPGPINSFALNGNLVESVFASGTNSSSGDTYISHWNGSTWNRVDSVLQSGSVVSDLSILELESGHSSNSVLPSKEVLLVSGNIILDNFGNASSVFFDGSSWQPAFITTKADGTTGSVNSFFSQQSKSYGQVAAKKYMKRGFVVLVSLAIAIGLTFLLVTLGLVVAHIRRKRLGYTAAPNRVSEAEMAETIPPATLFEEMANSGNSPRRRASGHL